jgi:hypothetical protein
MGFAAPKNRLQVYYSTWRRFIILFAVLVTKVFDEYHPGTH